MTSLADRTITALRNTHDELVALVPTLSDDQLTGPSGASDWTVAQVLSHLGSGAEIAHAGYRAALDGTAAPAQEFNQGVWDRWNALGPHDQAAQFLAHDAALVAMLEALTPGQRENLEIKLGFLPAPLPLASVAGMRLNETAQHAWDVRVALDPAATVDAEAAEVLLEHFTDGLGFLLGFLGKPEHLSEPARVRLQDTDVVIAIDGQVSASRPATDATATFSGEPEAAIRLLGGRLTAPYTPEGVEVSGNVTLDDLRRVFPGF
jgi:uncharacterized protein (TIGR03083 family)